jgi:hypothetical protein
MDQEPRQPTGPREVSDWWISRNGAIHYTNEQEKKVTYKLPKLHEKDGIATRLRRWVRLTNYGKTHDGLTWFVIFSVAGTLAAAALGVLFGYMVVTGSFDKQAVWTSIVALGVCVVMHAGVWMVVDHDTFFDEVMAPVVCGLLALAITISSLAT